MIARASRAYYNEFDPYAAQWLRNLIDAGHIAPGDRHMDDIDVLVDPARASQVDALLDDEVQTLARAAYARDYDRFGFSDL